MGSLYPNHWITAAPHTADPKAGINEVSVKAESKDFGELEQLKTIQRHGNPDSRDNPALVDPHEYSSDPADARAISNAQLVIVDGAGYDTWALEIMASGNTPNQKVVNVQQLVGAPDDANPHFWYSPYYVNATVKAIYKDLTTIDPSDSSYFRQQHVGLNSSLRSSYMSREAEIKQQFAGTPVAATEDIFVYMANATGLKVVSPPGFMEAVAEGNDPSAQDVATAQITS